MNLSSPLASLLPEADAGALTVLAHTETPLTGRRVAELAGEDTHPSTLRALNRLVAQGLVTVEPAGRAKLFRLNREHLLARSVLTMVGAGDELRNRLSEAISSWGIRPLHAALYGSVARGEAGTTSDIDVLVVRPDLSSPQRQQSWDAQLADLEERVHAWTGNDLSWLDTTVDDLRRAQAAREPLFESWRDDAIRLAGPSLTTLLREPAPKARRRR
ncbi:MAG: nucleotidyltransferase domain-containing protein [Tetrasphaera sp.]